MGRPLGALRRPSKDPLDTKRLRTKTGSKRSGDGSTRCRHRLAPPPIPTVLVLDNQMPGVSGLDVAERVLATTPGQRIILFSAYLDDDVRQRAHEIGISACVPKSDVNRLPALIEELAAQ